MMKDRTVSQTDEGRVGEIVDNILSRMDRGEQLDLEAYAKQYPEAADVLRHALPALKAVAESFCDRDGDQHARLTDIDPEQALGDFRIEREIGRGGMGVVYEARQVSLSRKVALKVILFASMAREHALQRFHNEVRAAAALDHPNIVSIYSVGEERGVHYYAMQLVRGQTWAALIEELRAMRQQTMDITASSLERFTSKTNQSSAASSVDEVAQPGQVRSDQLAATTRVELPANVKTLTSGGADRHYFSSVAQLGAQAADALQHAHDNGVLHRDIKPSNLMLDNESRVYVTDFGLARIESDAGMTMTGDLVGTLRYMSPEQALGKRVVIDQRCDIYSLGATLYEMVALRPVFEGANRQELLRQIALNEPIKLSTLNHAVPSELETIIHQSLAKNPEERYATSEELADDLRAFSQNRPIKAKPPSTLQRVSKWAQRHQGFVAATIVVLLIITTALAGSTWMVSQQQAQTTAALAQAKTSLREAESQRARADANFTRAQDTVDEFLTHVSENTLLNVPGLQPLRKDLLQLAVDYYERFAAEHTNDAALQSEVANAFHRLGTIRFALGDFSSAAEAHQRALDLRRALAGEDPRDEDKQHALAKSHLVAANFRGDDNSAITEVQRAIALTTALRHPVHRATLAEAYLALGSLRMREFEYNGESKTREDARSAFENSARVLEDLRDRSPASHWRDLLPKTYAELGTFHQLAGNDQLARRRDRQSLAILKQRVKEEANNPGVLIDLAGIYWNLHEHWKSIEIQKQLANRNPSVVGYRMRLASSYQRLGSMLKDPDTLQESINHLGRLSLEYPDEEIYVASMGAVYQTLGQLFVDLERKELSIAAFESAIECLTESIGEVGNAGGYQSKLGEAYSGLAKAYGEAGSLDQAVESQRMACQTNLRVSSESPESLSFRASAAQSFKCLGELLRRQGKLNEALDAIGQGINLLDVAFKRDSSANRPPNKTLGTRKLLGELHRESGITLYRDERWQAAIDRLRRAREMLNDDAPETQMFLAMAHWQLGRKDLAIQLFAEGAAWVDVENRASQHQQSLRAEAAELMKLTEVNRNQLVASFFATTDRQDASFYMARGVWHEDRGDYRRALEDLRRAATSEPSDFVHIAKRRTVLLLVRQNLLNELKAELPTFDASDSSAEFLAAASAIAFSGDELHYHSICERMRQMYATSESTTDLERLCTASCILPRTIEPSTLPLRELEHRLDVQALSPENHYRVMIAKAMVLLRLGKAEEAIAALRASQAFDVQQRKPNFQAMTLPLRAMCEYQLDQLKAARSTLAHATTVIEKHWTKLLNDELGDQWPDWLIAETLRREAAELLPNVTH